MTNLKANTSLKFLFYQSFGLCCIVILKHDQEVEKHNFQSQEEPGEQGHC